MSRAAGGGGNQQSFTDVVASGKARSSTGANQFEALSQFVSEQLVPMHLSTEDMDTFRTRARATTLGAVEVSEVWSSNPFVARRTSKLISRSSTPDYLKVGLQLSGVAVVSQQGRQATLRPGDFVLYDTTRPYQITGGPLFHMQAVMFSRETLRLSPAQVEWLTTQPISGRKGLASLVSQYLMGLAQQVHGTSPRPGCSHLADATLDLLAASFAERLAHSDTAKLHNGKIGLVARIRTHIDHRLHDPNLDPASIALAHHVSVRALHKLFEDQEQTVTGWIRSRRIERCRKDLVNPALAEQPVSSIGAHWGLSDPAHFSRLFKSTYGLSPRDYRAWALGRTVDQPGNVDTRTTILT